MGEMLGLMQGTNLNHPSLTRIDSPDRESAAS